MIEVEVYTFAQASFNRTFMELKFTNALVPNADKGRFNRTFMELK